MTLFGRWVLSVRVSVSPWGGSDIATPRCHTLRDPFGYSSCHTARTRDFYFLSCLCYYLDYMPIKMPFPASDEKFLLFLLTDSSVTVLSQLFPLRFDI